MNDADRQMALVLQKQFDMEIQVEKPPKNLVYSDKKKKKHRNVDPTKSLVDPSWELVDPTPNLHVLFMAFNERFFWNKLLAVTVAWSKRMTSCAGVCSYQSRGGVCKITVSEPLLKLRPRKDLVETLLHEMIHALLFVTRNNKDRDGHGPEFHKHMYRINGEAGTNISVYHDFHDEVKLYQQHWWRCNGPCQKRRPYFGFVRRAMNRAPGPNDRWWSEHQHTCGGKYIKVKEPEKTTKSKETKSEKDKDTKNKKVGDITKYVSVTKTSDNIKTISNIKGTGAVGTKNKNGTVVLNPKTVKNVTPEVNKTNIPVKTSGNIVTIKDLENNNNIVNKPKISPNKTTNDNKPSIDYSVVRNKWLNKFENKTSTDVKRKNENNNSNSPKKLKTETVIPKIQVKNVDSIVIPDGVNCPVCNKLIPNSELNEHLDQCLQNDNDIKSELNNDMPVKNKLKLVQCPSCNIFVEEKELNDHLDICLNKTEEPSTSPSTSKVTTNLTQCEICDNFVSSEDYATHTSECLNKFYDDIESKYNLNTSIETTACLVCNKDILKTDLDSHLDTCMGSAFDGNMDEENDDEDEEEEGKEEGDETKIKEYNCPICMKPIQETDMNKHIDECLTNNKLDFSEF